MRYSNADVNNLKLKYGRQHTTTLHSKVAYVLMAGGKLSIYSHSVGWKVKVVDGKNKECHVLCMENKYGEREVPEIETKRTIQKTFQDEQLIISQELCAVSSSTLPSSVSESALASHSPNQEFLLSLESLTDISQAKWAIQSKKKRTRKSNPSCVRKERLLCKFANRRGEVSYLPITSL